MIANKEHEMSKMGNLVLDIEDMLEQGKSFAQVARELEIPVIALAQVKAEVDKRTGDKRPGLGDIANSDEATREADQIAFLYRDEVYDRESPLAGMAELNFEKNRHGPTGRFDLRFTGSTMAFSDVPSRDGGDW
jgi:replicative DNA helicase